MAEDWRSDLEVWLVPFLEALRHKTRMRVYPADVGLTFPVAKTGRRRQYHMPDRPPVSTEAMLSGERWRKISWRRGTKGRLTCLFAARRVRLAEGHKHRMLVKARWICEQAHQQLKEELGLDHFEGRSWIGLHRHALMTMIAYAFLQTRRLKAAGRKKKSRRPAATTACQR